MKKKKCRFTVLTTLLLFTFSQNMYTVNAMASTKENNSSTELLIESNETVDSTTPVSSNSKEISKEELTEALSDYSDTSEVNVPHPIISDDIANDSTNLDYSETISLLDDSQSSTNSLTKRAVSVVTEESSSENTNKFNVTGMNVNTYLYGQIKEEDEERWYLTNAPQGKLTVYLQYAAGNDSMDLNLYLYKYDSKTGSISKVTSSVYKGNSPEQLSFMVPETGYYFIKVVSYDNFDANNKFALMVLSSQKCDVYEADDNINTKDLRNYLPTSIDKTLDSLYDVDWLEFNVPTLQNIYCNFVYKDTNAAYKMAVYDSSFNCLGVLNQNSHFSAKLVGNFYLKVWTDKGCSTDNTYNINFLDLDNVNKASSISENSNFSSGSLNSSNPIQWYKYTVTRSKDFSFALNNLSANYKCVVDFYDSNYNLVCTCKNNQFSSRENIKVGNYFIRVRNYDDSKSYGSYNIYFTDYTNLNKRSDYYDLPGKISFDLNSSTPDKWIRILPDTYKRFEMQFLNNDSNCTLTLYDSSYRLIATFKPNYYYTGTIPTSGIFIRIALKNNHLSSSGSLNFTTYTPPASSGGDRPHDDGSGFLNMIDNMCYNADKKCREVMDSIYGTLSSLYHY